MSAQNACLINAQEARARESATNPFKVIHCRSAQASKHNVSLLPLRHLVPPSRQVPFLSRAESGGLVTFGGRGDNVGGEEVAKVVLLGQARVEDGLEVGFE